MKVTDKKSLIQKDFSFFKIDSFVGLKCVNFQSKRKKDASFYDWTCQKKQCKNNECD
jgi:hypothetical protein